DATLFQAGDGSRLATPEVAMMHQQQVRTGFGGGVDKCLTGGDATDHSTDLATPFHLQTIRAVILKGSRFEEIVAVGHKFRTGCHHLSTLLKSEEHTSELQSRENLVCRLL